jgi:3-hydroxyisobutyrate dehydrogenase
VIFTSLPGPPQVEEVILGSGEVGENLRDGLVLFELSTSSLLLARRIHGVVAEKGASMLDAPVSGGPAGAASGQLTLWVGGERAVFDKHVELLRAFANAPHYVGAIGAGIVTKLMHNMLGYSIMLSLAEAFSPAVKAGPDPLDLWEALRLGLVGKGSR